MVFWGAEISLTIQTCMTTKQLALVSAMIPNAKGTATVSVIKQRVSI